MLNRIRVLRTIKGLGIKIKTKTKNEITYVNKGWTHKINRVKKDLWRIEVESPLDDFDYSIADTKILCMLIKRYNEILDWEENKSCQCPYWHMNTCELQENLYGLINKLKKAN